MSEKVWFLLESPPLLSPDEVVCNPKTTFCRSRFIGDPAPDVEITVAVDCERLS
jgi:hypothetical protein